MNTNSNAMQISRREALRRSLYGTAALTLGSRLGSNVFAATEAAAPAVGQVKAKSVIQIFLWGGM